ncbi:MAG: hypothetical protein ABIQ98_07815, partial [Sphingomicrobium sp.]
DAARAIANAIYDDIDKAEAALAASEARMAAWRERAEIAERIIERNCGDQVQVAHSDLARLKELAALNEQEPKP